MSQSRHCLGALCSGDRQRKPGLVRAGGGLLAPSSTQSGLGAGGVRAGPTGRPGSGPGGPGGEGLFHRRNGKCESRPTPQATARGSCCAPDAGMGRQSAVLDSSKLGMARKAGGAGEGPGGGTLEGAVQCCQVLCHTREEGLGGPDWKRGDQSGSHPVTQGDPTGADPWLRGARDNGGK